MASWSDIQCSNFEDFNELLPRLNEEKFLAGRNGIFRLLAAWLKEGVEY